MSVQGRKRRRAEARKKTCSHVRSLRKAVDLSKAIWHAEVRRAPLDKELDRSEAGSSNPVQTGGDDGEKW